MNDLNYEFNTINNDNNVLTNQNINHNNQKMILKLLKEDSDFISKIYSTIKENKVSSSNSSKKVTRINFDSKNRITIPKNIIGNLHYLSKDPLSFTKDNNTMHILCNVNHNLSVNDRIILQNVSSSHFNLKGGITLQKDSYFIKINHPNHGITIDDINKGFYILLSGVEGNSNKNTSLGNVSLSLINKIHQVNLTSDSDNIGSDNYYYIKVSTLSLSTINDTTSNIKITYQNICGINVNEINANYPISINQVNGYLVVKSIISNKEFGIELNENATKTIRGIGGTGIYYAKIKSYIPAWTKPNSYRISLNKSFENVTRIKLISTEFPNTEKVIRKYPTNETNNKLYFQVLEDKDHTYEIEITPGNYTVASLRDEIKSEIENVQRISFTDNLVVKEGNNALLEKSLNFSAIVETNQYTDIVSIALYSVVIIVKGITLSDDTYEDERKRIIVNHVDHGLSVGDKITIAGAQSTSAVPNSVLNIEHTIETVKDSNNYIIKLPLHNDSNSTANTGGGSAINILIPLSFRLLFNYPDTIGKILGFRNVGEQYSITPFAPVIYNNIAYEYDYFKDAVGNEIFFNNETRQVENDVIQLFGHNYILMCCTAFKGNESLSTNNIPGVFAKLLLSDSPGSILFNQYIQLAEVLSKPIKTLSELEFKFYSPSGSLYEFNGIDHSFTLEIYEESTQISGTNINVKNANIGTPSYDTSTNERLDIRKFQEDKA
jgi:hypothetical protein